MRARCGQAVVEICVALPVVCTAVLLAAQGLLAASAGVSVERALDRAVIAAAAGEDPLAAAREALPDALAAGASVRGGRGRVLIVVHLPGPFGTLQGSARVAAP
jgi:hypothetical protein